MCVRLLLCVEIIVKLRICVEILVGLVICVEILVRLVISNEILVRLVWAPKNGNRFWKILGHESNQLHHKYEPL